MPNTGLLQMLARVSDGAYQRRISTVDGQNRSERICHEGICGTSSPREQWPELSSLSRHTSFQHAACFNECEVKAIGLSVPSSVL